MNEEIVESPLEAKIAEYDTLEKIVERFVLGDYCDEIGHKLENNVAFVALQRYAGHWDSFVRRLEVAEDIVQQILVRMGDAPLDMILPCPACGMLHVDAPEPEMCECGHVEDEHGPEPHGIHDHSHCRADMHECECREFKIAWTNPPHKTHLCHGCGIKWRPADIPTNGVAEIKTRGENDTWPEVKA